MTIEDIFIRAEEAAFLASDDGSDEAHRHLMSIILELEAAFANDPSARISYAIGYCWYNASDVPERVHQAEIWLRRALEIDPTEQYARLYLGHLLFDEKSYQDARRLFAAIPSGHFTSLGQYWRDLKVREILVACDIYLSPESVGLDALWQIMNDYEKEPNDNTAVPVELIRSVTWARKQLVAGERFRTVGARCAEWIKNLEMSDVFAAECRVLLASNDPAVKTKGEESR